MDRIKAKGYINIAHKAGYLIIGGDKLDGYNQKLYLVLIDKSAGKSSQKIASRLKENGVEILEVDALPEICDISTCKILGIKNKDLSVNIKSNLVD